MTYTLVLMPMPLSSSKSADNALPLRNQKSSLAIWEIWFFALICTVDMLSTLYWYSSGQASELNPLLSYFLKRSIAAFCIAKLVSFVPLLLICAYYHKQYKQFITVALRIAISAYILIYALSVGIQFLPSR